MIKCPFCQTEYVENTVFCSECGQCLLDEHRRETDPLSTMEICWEGNQPNKNKIAIPLQQNTEPQILQLKIQTFQRELEIMLNKSILVGRMDPNSTVLPEIDLTHDGEMSKSVSRRHAQIVKRENIVIIQDLGSHNGTFVNGKRLVPYLPEPLCDGDTLQLGRILIEVRIRDLAMP